MKDVFLFGVCVFMLCCFHLDDVSAESSTEYPDKLSSMEVRLQAQEDEITLLKSSLADALRRLHLHDQQIPLLKQQLIAGRRFLTDYSMLLYIYHKRFITHLNVLQQILLCFLNNVNVSLM